MLPSPASPPSRGSRSPVETIRVVLLIETAFYRDGLAEALRHAPAVAVVGQLQDWREASPLLHAQRPDVVLLDVPGTERVAAIRTIGSTLAHVRIVALAVVDSSDDVVPLAEAGVAGYVTPSQSLDELVGVIASVARGELPCSPRVAAGLLRRVAVLADARKPLRGDDLLTSREREIVDLIGCGLSNRQIGEHLVIEVSTVKNHVHNILEKLQVNRRAEAVARVEAGRGSRSGPARTDPRAHFAHTRA
jgi:two-component system nitrate/nitrite response regulator NarL